MSTEATAFFFNKGKTGRKRTDGLLTPMPQGLAVASIKRGGKRKTQAVVIVVDQHGQRAEHGRNGLFPHRHTAAVGRCGKVSGRQLKQAIPFKVQNAAGVIRGHPSGKTGTKQRQLSGSREP